MIKKKRVSKKSKTAWRKHTDVKDVEDFLEDQRLEERLGTPFATKEDDELFIVDTKPIGENETIEAPILSAKQRKRLSLSNPPKCFQVLENTSKVQDPAKKRNIVRPVGTRESDLSKLTHARKEKKGILLRKYEDAKNNRTQARELKKKLKKTREDFELDLWGKDVPAAKKVPASLISEWIPKEARDMLTPRESRVKPPRVKVDRPTIPAVTEPHPGISYNPSLQDHQELLRLVVEKERELMKKEAHIERVTTKMFKHVRQDQRETQWLSEMFAGLPEIPKPGSDIKAASDDDSEPSDNEYKAVNPPVKNKEKKLKAKRKAKEQKVEKEQLKRAKVEKKKIADIYKLRFLNTAIEKANERLAKLREIRLTQREQKKANCSRKLNAHQLPKIEPDFTTADELSGNLRNVTSKGSLLKDRFLSLQQRSILAPSKIFFKKKQKVKTYFKPGHKVNEKDVEKYLEVKKK